MADFLRLLAFTLSVACASASPVSFVSPACGKPVTGTVTLTASVASPLATSVAFSIGSHSIGSQSMGAVDAPPLVWNSAEAMDGVSAIQAVASDAFGNRIGSTECLVQVSNRQAALRVDAPDLTRTLSGTVSISVTGSDALAFPAVWTLNVDGEAQSTQWTDGSWKSPNSVTFQLDTTRFANGAHELHISMDSRTGPAQPQWVNWRGMVNRVAQFDNERAWMDIIPEFQSLHLTPGGQKAVGCKRLFTDGSQSPCGSPAYQAADPSVAAVDPGSGMIAAQNPGFTLVTVQDGLKKASARVWVTADPHVPHFGGDGALLRGYQDGHSLFVVAPFFLDPDLLSGNAPLRSEVALAGVNTLGFGMYQNPRDLSKTFGDWKTGFDGAILPKMQWSRNNGFHLLPTGDDIFRRIGMDAWFTMNWPFGRQSVEYAASALAATGVGIGIEGIDEGSSIWGSRPAPEGRIGRAPYLFDRIDCESGNCAVNWMGNPLAAGWGFALQGASDSRLDSAVGAPFTVQQPTAAGFQFQAAGPVSGTFDPASSPNLEYLWFAGRYCAGATACNPAVPNGALATMRSWLAAPPSSVPVSFPPLASDSPKTHGNWMGPGGISDYASNYFTSIKVRTTYPWSEGIQEMVSSMESEFFARQPYLMLDRPQLMLVSLAGPSYTKSGDDAGVYAPGVDALSQPGVGPEHVSALMMDAAALGGAGIRLYFFEPAEDLPNRAQAAPGTAFQTGTNPFNLQVESWRAMGYAANLLTHVLEPYLLGVALDSPAFGRNITSAARQGENGRMLLIVNGNDWPRTIQVDLSSYALGFGTARYRVRASGIATDALPAGLTVDTPTLAAGETVAYLFPNSAAAMPLVQTVVANPNPGSQPTAIQYAYVYASGLNQGAIVRCTSSCSVSRDPSLGGFFYQFLDAGGASWNQRLELPVTGGRHR